MLQEEIKNTIEVLKSGGVILYPTDTIWGLGCDATNEDAVQKLILLKNRLPEKSFVILLDTDTKLQSYIQEVPEVAYDLIEYAEHPLTVVFSAAKNLAQSAIGKDGSVGVRIVKHEFCTGLLSRFRKPIVSTSANLTGQPTPRFFDEIDPQLIAAVNYVVDFEQEDRTLNKPSTIVKLGPSGQFEFIRK